MLIFGSAFLPNDTCITADFNNFKSSTESCWMLIFGSTISIPSQAPSCINYIEQLLTETFCIVVGCDEHSAITVAIYSYRRRNMWSPRPFWIVTSPLGGEPCISNNDKMYVFILVYPEHLIASHIHPLLMT